MKQSRHGLLALPLLLAFSGCYRQGVYAVDSDGNLLSDRGGSRESEVTLGFLYGVVAGKTEVECPYGIARVDTGLVWYSFPVMYVTAGIVAPMKVTYICNEAPDQPSDGNGGW